MIGSPHFAQMRLVRWLISSRFASEARAVFESSPFLGISLRPLSPIFYLSGLLESIGLNRAYEPYALASIQIQYITTGRVMSIGASHQF
jgi:hypothetical protein